MKLKFRDNSEFSILVPTSMGLRITPAGSQPVHCSGTFTMQVTSAETNVASAASYLGLKVKVLTAFVKGSPFARMIKDSLASRHMDFEGPEIEQGGPWGFRHQINVADSGFGSRGPVVYNDRAGEVGRLLKPEYFDLEKIFGKDGVKIAHLSGLIAALSPDTGRLCLEIAKKAREHGTKVSFDLNHRASFWKGRENELRALFSDIASMSDILVGNEEDFQLCLGIKGPEAGGRDISSKISGFREMIGRVKETYPQVQVFATTLREVISSNSHLWGALMLAGEKWHVIEPRGIGVLDRIGGGDAFVGGMLYAMLRGWDPEKWIQFGWANGALAVTMLSDYSQPPDEEQVWNIWKGNARVQR